MEKEKSNSSSTSSSTFDVSCGVAEIKQEEMEDRTLEYQENLNKVLDGYTKRYKKSPEKNRIRYDEAFDRQVEALVYFHHKYGHWEVPRKGKYTSLNKWVKHLRQMFKRAYYEGGKYNNSTFPRHRYEKLVAIGFPFVENVVETQSVHEDDDDSINDSSCSSASPSTANKNRVLTSSGDNHEEIENQRNLDKMLDKYTARYEMLSEKQQKVFDAKFDRHVEALDDFHREYGHWKVPPKSNQSGLYEWLFNLRTIYKFAYYHRECYNAITLPRHRYEKLVAIGYPFEDIVENTRPKIDDAFKTRPNASPSDKMKGEEEEDRTLEYQANLDKVLDEYTERYEKLAENFQKHNDKAFDRRVKALVAFHRVYGHWKVPRKRKYTSLNGWVEHVRQMFKCAYYEGKNYRSDHIFPRHRYEKLVAIGFPFVENQTVNEDDNDSINDSSCSSASPSTTNSNRVLARSEVKQEVEEDGTLEYQANLDKMLDEYTKRYEKLPEKRQMVYDEAFDRHVEALADFHREYGNWEVPSSEKELHVWFRNLRQIYRCAYYDGEIHPNPDLTFPRHRYEKLVSIGYPFEEIMPRIPSLVSLPQQENSLDLSIRSSKRNRNKLQNSRENEVKSLKAKILELEKENETHYATIYRLKDEKDALEEKVEVYKKRIQQFEYHKEESIASSCSKRQRNDLESNYAENEDFQQERQLLIHQFTTENHRQIPDSSSSKSSMTMQSTCSKSSKEAEIKRLQQERQILIDQLRASTENYKQILDLVPRH